MEPDSREEKNALAFLEMLKEAGQELRPISYMTMQNIALLGLVFGKGTEARLALHPDRLRDEMNAYVFIQTAPGEMVARAIRSFRKALADRPRDEAFEDFLCGHVEPFLSGLGLEKKKK